MLSSGFFNAELVDEEYDRVYDAEQFAEYFHMFIANGVFPNPATNLQVVSNTTPSMSISVSEGTGWINGYFVKNDSLYPLAIQVANASLNRVDAVVLRWNKSSRTIDLAVKTGTPGPSPVAPNIQRDSDIYELMIATVMVNAGATSITQSMITDKRPDSSVCGWVTGAVEQIDTTNLFAQYNAAFQEWFDDVQSQLEGDVATNLLNRINQVQTELQANIDLKVNISDKASVAQAQAATDDTKWMTAKKVFDLIKAKKCSYDDMLKLVLQVISTYSGRKMNLSSSSASGNLGTPSGTGTYSTTTVMDLSSLPNDAKVAAFGNFTYTATGGGSSNIPQTKFVIKLKVNSTTYTLSEEESGNYSGNQTGNILEKVFENLNIYNLFGVYLKKTDSVSILTTQTNIGNSSYHSEKTLISVSMDFYYIQ